MREQFEQASMLHQQGKLVEAEAIYRTLLIDEPDQPVVNARLAMILAQTKRGREALPVYAKAIDQIPNDDQLVQQAAHLAAQLGENILTVQTADYLAMYQTLVLVQDNLVPHVLAVGYPKYMQEVLIDLCVIFSTIKWTMI